MTTTTLRYPACRRGDVVCAVMWIIVSVILANLPASVFGYQLIDPPAVTTDDAKMIVKQLLIENWERQPELKAKSAAMFASAPPSTLETSLAYLLNRQQHNEARTALKVAEQMTLDYPTSIDGWWMLSYLHALTNDYERALIDMRSLKKHLSVNANLSPPQRQQVVSQVGKLIGYLQGPVKERLKPDLLESTAKFIAEGLSAAELDAFNQGRETVLARYEELQQTQNQKTERELEQQQAADENLTANLTNQNQTIQQQLQSIVGEQQRLRTEASQRLADLTRQVAPLESQLANISSQISSIQYDLQLLYTDLYYAQNQNQNQPNIQFNTNYFISGQIRDRELAMYSLQGNFNSLSSQLQALRGQITQTQNGYNAQINGLERQARQLNNTLRRNDVKLGKIAGGPELASGKKAALENRLMALSSYVELPVALYRQQMIDGLSNK